MKSEIKQVNEPVFKVTLTLSEREAELLQSFFGTLSQIQVGKLLVEDAYSITTEDTYRLTNELYDLLYSRGEDELED